MLLSLSRASRNRDDPAQLVAGLDDELDNGGSTGGLSRCLLDGYLEPDLASFLAKK